ncbi:hypothetical protein ACFCXH_29190 [Streptomyces nojiriensis]|uniref:hypothetical protein n=1 Tax=Streptomyces nojiriensis TaxID=66374 RepID=UPI0035D5EA9C
MVSHNGLEVGTSHDDTNLPRGRQQRHLKRAGIAAILSAVFACISTIMRSIPWPDLGLKGEAYLTYAQAHRGFEIQAILLCLAFFMYFAFTLLLARAYAHSVGKWTLPSISITAGGALYLLLSVVGAGCYATIGLLSHSEEFSRNTPASMTLISMLWSLTMVMLTLGGAFTAVVWWGVYAANKVHPLLPAAVAGPGSVAVGALSLCGLATLLVPTGRWSPTSLYAGITFGLPFYIIGVIAGAALLRRARKREVQEPDQVPRAVRPRQAD